MGVAFFENDCSPFTTMAINVRVGSDDERKDHGISHFLEHVLFQGTRKRKAFEIVNAIEGIGGYINADTSENKTIYYARVPRGREDVLADVLSDMILNPAFPEPGVAKEKGIISSEISNQVDDPFEHSVVSAHELITGKPSTIGTRKSVSAMTKQKLVDFYGQWYAPNNMTAIVAGSEGAFERVHGYLERAFSPLPPARLPNRQKIGASTPAKNFSQDRASDDVYVTMATPVRGFDSDRAGTVAFGLLVSILDRPMSGRLNVATRLKKGLLYNISCNNITTRDYGIFEVVFSTSKKKAGMVKRIVQEEVEKSATMEPDELENSKNHVLSEVMADFETGLTLVDWAGTWDALGDIKMAEKYGRMVEKMTLEDIKRAKASLDGRWFESVVG